ITIMLIVIPAALRSLLSSILLIFNPLLHFLLRPAFFHNGSDTIRLSHFLQNFFSGEQCRCILSLRHFQPHSPYPGTFDQIFPFFDLEQTPVCADRLLCHLLSLVSCCETPECIAFQFLPQKEHFFVSRRCIL